MSISRCRDRGEQESARRVLELERAAFWLRRGQSYAGGQSLIREAAIIPQVDVPGNLIRRFCRRWKIREFYLFGSVLREDFRPDSDVDVLVTFYPSARWDFAEFEDMEEELGQILGRRADLIERSAVERSANYIRRRHILDSAVPVYGV